jgi:hypothetical protein
MLYASPPPTLIKMLPMYVDSSYGPKKIIVANIV